MTFIDQEAEMHVVACGLNPDAISVFEAIDDDLLTTLKARHLLCAIRAMHKCNAPLDIFVLADLLRTAGTLEGIGMAEVTRLHDIWSPAVGAYMLDRLRDLHSKRSARKMLADGLARVDGGEEIGPVMADTQATLDGIQKSQDRLEAHPLTELSEIDPPGAELIRHRFLCRGAGALLVGPSGVGKSTLALQLALSFAIGRALFGLSPMGDISSLVIQAENDDADLREMRDGALSGLNFAGQDAALAAQRVLVHSCDSQSGEEFLRVIVEPLVRRHRPKILWLDPAFAFLGGDASAQTDVSKFLRNGLNPILHRHNCACVIIHHTNKPRVGKEKGDWQAGDFAYLGAGSAEWTNWARAVLSIQSLGSHTVFKLHAAKRGGRLRWQDDNGDFTRERHLAHASEPGAQYWRDADPDEIPDSGDAGRPTKCSANDVLQRLNGTERTFTEICADFAGDASSRTVQRRLGELAKDGKAVKTKAGKWRAK